MAIVGWTPEPSDSTCRIRAGVGRVLAHWIVTGRPDVDVTAFNIDRLHATQTNPQYRRERTVESQIDAEEESLHDSDQVGRILAVLLRAVTSCLAIALPPVVASGPTHRTNLTNRRDQAGGIAHARPRRR